MRSILAAALIVPFGTVASAQIVDVSQLNEFSDTEIVTADGEDVGEIEEALVDESGEVVAAVVEIDDGFLDLGDSEVVISLDELTWDNGRYTTSMTEDEMQNLPEWDD